MVSTRVETVEKQAEMPSRAIYRDDLSSTSGSHPVGHVWNTVRDDR